MSIKTVRAFLLSFLLSGALLAAPTLYRLDETLYSFTPKNSYLPQEIRLWMPGFDDSSFDYRLASALAKHIETVSNVDTLYSQEVDLTKSSNLPEPLRKKWQLSFATEEWFENHRGNKIARAVAVDYESVSNQILVLKVVSASFLERLANKAASYAEGVVGKDRKVGGFAIGHTLWDEASFPEQFLEKGAYTDAFTKLATLALQTDETPFVSEATPQGGYEFLLNSDGQLDLKPISENNSLEARRAAIRAYRTYLRKAFAYNLIGNDPDLSGYPQTFEERVVNQIFSYLKGSYNIDFYDMEICGKPLLPDHIFKGNIAVNKIEMPELRSLFVRIEYLKQAWSSARSFDTPSQFYQALKDLSLDRYFCLREVRGLYCSFKASGLSFEEYLNTYQQIDKSVLPLNVRNLTPQAVDQLMQILLVDTNLLEKGKAHPFFTGREITHLAIAGYKTMGNPEESDPCRSVFELLHIYPDLANATEEAYHELLSFVVAKKALYSYYAGEKFRHIGRVIPYMSQKGQHRWYYVDGFLNDGRGDYNYVLVPACKAYTEEPDAPITAKNPPLIKLYRSTASDNEAESSLDSKIADTNPDGVGSTNSKAGDLYELLYFKRCTMPLWVGYLVAVDLKEMGSFGFAASLDRENPLDEAVANFPQIEPTADAVPQSVVNARRIRLTQFIASQKRNTPSLQHTEGDAEIIVEKLKEKLGDAFTRYLSHPQEAWEWDFDKFSEDIIFTGHSLGGALSQSGLYQFGPEYQRIPLAGARFRCFAFDPPGCQEKEASGFMQFGRSHRELIQLLSDKPWEIYYQFEFGDTVPQGGSCFLGVFDDTSYPQNDAWFTLSASVCKPKSAPQGNCILTAPTHGHRFSSGLQQDYKRTPVSASLLKSLKENWFLSGEVKNLFGYYFTSPRITEHLRNTPGRVFFVGFQAKKKIDSFGVGPHLEADKDGVIHFSEPGGYAFH